MVITIITAFYDIKRENLDDFKRDYTKYFNYFSFWAGLKNPLIVYTTQEHKDAILNIRKSKGLEDLTQVIVKPLEEFAPQDLEKIQAVFRDFDQTQGRKNPNNIECLSVWYCYVVYCKPFFVCDAMSRGITTNEILWLDFGFNHGGEFYTNAQQFNFTLSVQDGIANDKMNLFKIKDDEVAHIATVYFNMNVFLIGGLLFGNAKAWEQCKEHFQQALQAFVSLNIFDDDQALLLWCYRNYPQSYQSFRVYDWFSVLDAFIPKEVAKTLEKNPKNSLPYRLAKAKFKEAKASGDYGGALVHFVRYALLKMFKRKG